MPLGVVLSSQGVTAEQKIGSARRIRLQVHFDRVIGKHRRVVPLLHVGLSAGLVETDES